MDDHRLDDLLEEARDHYRVPPAANADALWSRIEATAFPRAAVRRDWRLTGLAAAACLVIGAIAGRWSATTAPAMNAAAATTASAQQVSRPYQKATEDLLGQTAVLLTALNSDRAATEMASHLNDEATQLLGTTRLLLDSPAATDPQLRTLLLDLELTLARVARLQPARRATEVPLINAAVAERDIVPRIRSAVMELGGEY